MNGSGTQRGFAVAAPLTQTDGTLHGRSHRGGITTAISGSDEAIVLQLELPDNRGPRCGVMLDLDHLDRAGSSAIHHGEQLSLMPVMVATAADLSWAWVVWHRSDTDYLITVVDGPSAGWHIHYSYAGHRMEGFSILARADDVIAPGWPGERLPHTTKLSVKLAHAASLQQAQQRIADMLGLLLPLAAQSTAVLGESLTCTFTHSDGVVRLIAPDGSRTEYAPNNCTLPMQQAGAYTLETIRQGRSYRAQLYVIDAWQRFAERSVNFHRQHYQQACGAFGRALTANLDTDAANLAGNAFADPDQVMSCRTGEFGGFGAWAQMLHQRHFGPDDEMSESVGAYFNWMCNVGRESDPRPGTLCFQAQESQGLPYSAYHFYQEICYAQHEAWFIRQLADAINDGAGDLLVHLEGLITHYLNDHVDDRV